MAAAYEELSSDTATLRMQVERDRLDQVTLSATVAKLLLDVGQLGNHVSEVRQELTRLRAEVAHVQATVPTVPDPLLPMLAEHSADLREQLTSTQQVVAELAGRLTDLLTSRLDGFGVSERSVATDPPVTAAADDADQAAAAKERVEGVRRVIRLAPTVTRLDSVPDEREVDAGIRRQARRPDPAGHRSSKVGG